MKTANLKNAARLLESLKLPKLPKLSKLVCLLALGVLSMVRAGSAMAQQDATAPAVVLVHGAWADGSSWDRVVPLLQKHGLKVVAVQLQRASLAGDAAIVRRAVAAQGAPVVLVGHSYGGAVITEAGTADQVRALVYVAAFAPGDGESIADITRPYPPGPFQAGFIADSAGYVRLSDEVYHRYFVPDLPEARRAVLAATQGPVFAGVLEDKVTRAAWHDRPVYWALPDNDQIIPTPFQQLEAARTNAHVTPIIRSGHVPLQSHPGEVTAVILQAVTEVIKEEGAD
ncbi:pimeloyl-ACP methyl ester carboxylesterase [Pseudoduganella lurida]|uniref:Pimeloyl-ACP methyl ester carboxylesterase n=1 Tax=Pseudoduganella lurida TaxID=1036180 RepID=A0A562RBR2_9BURK|nr:alpha/beta hydrolase [Pseudoduganella lurida]TWI66491.1 pimeloyl-ACP methyl ester carboxylesterase [Pseudoduganella lurida]